MLLLFAKDLKGGGTYIIINPINGGTICPPKNSKIPNNVTSHGKETLGIGVAAMLPNTEHKMQ